jgi:hypothetical protein
MNKLILLFAIPLFGCGAHNPVKSLPPNRSIESCNMTYFDYPVSPRKATPEEQKQCEKWLLSLKGG